MWNEHHGPIRKKKVSEEKIKIKTPLKGVKAQRSNWLLKGRKNPAMRENVV